MAGRLCYDMEELKYFEILKKLGQLREDQGESKLKISLLSNIIVSQLTELLEYALRAEGIPATVRAGNYDNIVQDAGALSDDEIVIVFWEISNLTDGLQYKADHLSVERKNALIEKTAGEMSLVFESLGNNKLVLFNEFHAYPFVARVTDSSGLGELAQKMNAWLRANVPAGFRLIDTGLIIGKIGFEQSFDIRNFYSSKALYSIGFFREYVRQTLPYILSATGKTKKVLVLDCDNTLWKGIVGEDGMDGIRMSAGDKAGLPYHAVQHKISFLAKNGVIVCLCSKNNPEDVDAVLSGHPDMVLKDDQIVLKKINWNDKASNIREMARELNVGLDSFVFVDDSEFEVNLVKSELPEVKVFRVPEKTYRFPALMDDIATLFYKPVITKEDKSKTAQYKAQVKRSSSRKAFGNIDEYIRSLEIRLKIHINNHALTERMAQMTQKTNQFNLTTKRYTEQEIKNMLNSGNWALYALEVSDKYGDSGVTGLAIVNNNNGIAVIDTFLLSCRIIGRNIEYRFMDEIMKNINADIVQAQYIKTMKNVQVSDFYEKTGFLLKENTEDVKHYEIKKDAYRKNKKYNYIKVTYGTAD